MYEKGSILSLVEDKYGVVTSVDFDVHYICLVHGKEECTYEPAENGPSIAFPTIGSDVTGELAWAILKSKQYRLRSKSNLQSTFFCGENEDLSGWYMRYKDYIFTVVKGNETKKKTLTQLAIDRATGKICHAEYTKENMYVVTYKEGKDLKERQVDLSGDELIFNGTHIDYQGHDHEVIAIHENGNCYDGYVELKSMKGTPRWVFHVNPIDIKKNSKKKTEFKVGERVKILSGPVTGAVGIVKRIGMNDHYRQVFLDGKDCNIEYHVSSLKSLKETEKREFKRNDDVTFMFKGQRRNGIITQTISSQDCHYVRWRGDNGESHGLYLHTNELELYEKNFTDPKDIHSLDEFKRIYAIGGQSCGKSILTYDWLKKMQEKDLLVYIAGHRNFEVGDKVESTKTRHKGTVTERKHDRVVVTWDTGKYHQTGISELEAVMQLRNLSRPLNKPKQGDEMAAKEVADKLKKAKTKAEVKATEEGVKEVFEVRATARKQKVLVATEYFIDVEKEARAKRKEADELREKLGVTDDQMKELFDEAE